nr:uncharacterized mitochondrial protein AtMg00810-like [Tanacetum cinerariifolium]
MPPATPTSVASPVPVEGALAPVELSSSPSLTTVDKDAPSPKTVFEESSSSDVIPTTMHSDARPTEKHLHVVKKIFRYLRGIVNRGLWYSKDSAIALTAFAYADHAGYQDTRRSTSGSIQLLGDRLVSWSSKRQKSIAISSTKAKYIALYQFIKEQVENGVVELYFVRSEYQLADIFTKALCRERIEFLIDKLRMGSITLKTLKELADEAEEL